MEADPLLAAFNLADVNGMQLSLFGQLFLTHAGLGAVLPDRGSENPDWLSCARHSLSKKQEVEKSNTPNMGVFGALFCLLRWRRSDKKHLI